MIKVFVINNSIIVRDTFSKIFKKAEDIELIATSSNPIEAFTLFKSVGLPDVFILDIEMGEMSGFEFLQMINEQNPIPVIMCSEMLDSGNSIANDALQMGAVDTMHKPSQDVLDKDKKNLEFFFEKVRVASKAKLTPKKVVPFQKKVMNASKMIVAIGASTGGVQAIETLTKALKQNHPAIVIVQHMPAGFTKSFADRLAKQLPSSDVKEASQGDVLSPGRILIAPGDLHIEIVKSGFSYQVTLKDSSNVSMHKPSVDVLFASMRKKVKSQGIGIILTGMGEDGAKELLEMKKMGIDTYVQSEESCVVYGMPKKAVDIGAVKSSHSLQGLANIINALG